MEIEKNILSLIPQKPPFVMIDELLFSDDTTTRCKFQVTADNVFTINGQFVEAGLLENMAQTAAARAGYISRLENNPVKIGYIGAVKNLEILCLPETNDELISEIQIEEVVFNMSSIKGKVWCNDKLMAECEMKIFMA